MQFSFLGFSSMKIMEFNLDIKDIVILKYFNDFKNSGKMKYEVVDGKKYYWINYQSIENELPFLGLSKRSIMARMLKMTKLKILNHYTKKDGGTFSYYDLGEKFNELLAINFKNQSKEEDLDLNVDNSLEIVSSNITKGVHLNDEGMIKKEEGVCYKEESSSDFEDLKHKNVQGVSIDSDRGCALKGRTKTNILNNNKTIVTNIYNNINNTVYNNIKDIVNTVLNYLNEKVEVNYKNTNTKIINLIKLRVKEGFTVEDFKLVIDKKINEWKGTSFEQYLNPFTLFGDKFELYLNQKVIKSDGNNNYKPKRKLKFDNFTGRTYDYDKLERQLLGWE